MNAKTAGMEVALTINSLSREDKIKFFKAMSMYLNQESKTKLEDALGVVI